MKHSLQELEKNLQRLSWIVSQVSDKNYGVGLTVVPEKYGGIAKYKLFVKGPSASTVFYIAAAQFNAYGNEELVQFVLKAAKRDGIAPFPKKPKQKYSAAVLPTQKYASTNELHPPKRLGGLVDLKQQVRMTCCAEGPVVESGGMLYWLANIQTGIIHLNDKHKWDRNKIADWLEAQDVDIAIGG